MLYHKASSRGAYGHDPSLSVFEEHRLDSTTTDITTALFIFIDNVRIVLSDLVESSGYSSKRIMSICASGRGFMVCHDKFYLLILCFSYCKYVGCCLIKSFKKKRRKKSAGFTHCLTFWKMVWVRQSTSCLTWLADRLLYSMPLVGKDCTSGISMSGTEVRGVSSAFSSSSSVFPSEREKHCDITEDQKVGKCSNIYMKIPVMILNIM